MNRKCLLPIWLSISAQSVSIIIKPSWRDTHITTTSESSITSLITNNSNNITSTTADSSFTTTIHDSKDGFHNITTAQHASNMSPVIIGDFVSSFLQNSNNNDGSSSVGFQCLDVTPIHALSLSGEDNLIGYNCHYYSSSPGLKRGNSGSTRIETSLIKNLPSTFQKELNLRRRRPQRGGRVGLFLHGAIHPSQINEQHNGTLILPPSPRWSFHDSHSPYDDNHRISPPHRHLSSPPTQTRTILVIRLTSDGISPTVSPSLLSNAFFSPTSPSLRSQYLSCSHSHLILAPHTFPFSLPTSITTPYPGILDISITPGATDFYTMSTAAKRHLTSTHSLNLSPIHHLVYILPPTVTDSGLTPVWAGIADVSGQESWYPSPYATRVSTLVHETGHNLGWYHSAESGVEYGDGTCAMGKGDDVTHYSVEDKPLRCFNAVKMWSVRREWGMEGGMMLVNPSLESWRGRIVGVNDFKESRVGVHWLALRLKPPNGRGDLYVGYNIREGMTADTGEYPREVIVYRKGGDGKSHLLHHLNQGDFVEIANFGESRRNLVISSDVAGVDEGGVDYATVNVRLVGRTCAMASDCDDGNPCTVEQCPLNGFCSYAPVPNCCGNTICDWKDGKETVGTCPNDCLGGGIDGDEVEDRRKVDWFLTYMDNNDPYPFDTMILNLKAKRHVLVHGVRFYTYVSQITEQSVTNKIVVGTSPSSSSGTKTWTKIYDGVSNSTYDTDFIGGPKQEKNAERHAHTLEFSTPILIHAGDTRSFELRINLAGNEKLLLIGQSDKRPSQKVDSQTENDDVVMYEARHCIQRVPGMCHDKTTWFKGSFMYMYADDLSGGGGGDVVNDPCLEASATNGTLLSPCQSNHTSSNPSLTKQYTLLLQYPVKYEDNTKDISPLAPHQQRSFCDTVTSQLPSDPRILSCHILSQTRLKFSHSLSVQYKLVVSSSDTYLLKTFPLLYARRMSDPSQEESLRQGFIDGGVGDVEMIHFDSRVLRSCICDVVSTVCRHGREAMVGRADGMFHICIYPPARNKGEEEGGGEDDGGMMIEEVNYLVIAQDGVEKEFPVDPFDGPNTVTSVKRRGRVVVVTSRLLLSLFDNSKNNTRLMELSCYGKASLRLGMKLTAERPRERMEEDDGMMTDVMLEKEETVEGEGGRVVMGSFELDLVVEPEVKEGGEFIDDLGGGYKVVLWNDICGSFVVVGVCALVLGLV